MDSLVEDCRLDDTIMSPPWGEWGRSATLGMIAGFSKLMLCVFNTTTVVHQDTWLKVLRERPRGTGLITVSNHTSMFDDPGVLCAITPWSFFWTEHAHHGNRWSICAKEVCFKNEALRQFFQTGKVLPILRGGGVTQPVMGTASAAVARGDWLHIFPEGRIMYPGTLGTFRWGVGKIVCDARRVAGGRDPVVLPFYHSNMGSVLPKDAIMFKFGNQVTVTMGEPVELADITCRCNKAGEDQQQVWQDITMRIRSAMHELEVNSPANLYQGPNEASRRVPEDAMRSNNTESGSSKPNSA